MDQGSLVAEQIDAGAKFLAEIEKKIPVMAGFWLKANDVESWHLYVASEAFNDHTLDMGYAEVLRVATELRDPNLGPFQVKLIKPGHPFAKSALDFLQLYRGTMAMRLRQRNFGGASVDEVYIYPTLTPVT